MKFPNGLPLTITWRANGPESHPGVHLYGKVEIDGMFLLHAEAFRVARNEEGTQEVDGDYLVCQGQHRSFLDFCAAVDPDSGFELHEIDGFNGQYAIFIYPHSD